MRIYMDLCEGRWIYADLYGFMRGPRIYVDLYGSMRIYMDLYGFTKRTIARNKNRRCSLAFVPVACKRQCVTKIDGAL